MPTTLTYPGLITQPFAGTASGPNFGGKNTIPIASATPLASFSDGFPAVTMLPISGGGVPPAGKDFNGVFYFITAFQAWVNGGGRFKYDSTLSSTVGGYPAGAVLMLNDNVSEVICTTAGTTNDPNANMAGWAPFSGALSGAGFYQLDSGAVNAYVVARSPGISAYVNGMTIAFKAIHTNTGASTINAGAGSVPLKRNDGSALVSGDIASGSIYEAIYDASTVTFIIKTVVPSQINGAFFATQHNVIGSRVIGTTYTNTTSKPMFVSICGTNNTTNTNLYAYVNGVIVFAFGQPYAGTATSASCIVPPGATYSIAPSAGAFTAQAWIETY